MVDLGQLQKNLTKSKRDAKTKAAAAKRAWEAYRRAKSLAVIAKDDVEYHADELTRATYELTVA
jgi:hypothetical protein